MAHVKPFQITSEELEAQIEYTEANADKINGTEPQAVHLDVLYEASKVADDAFQAAVVKQFGKGNAGTRRYQDRLHDEATTDARRAYYAASYKFLDFKRSIGPITTVIRERADAVRRLFVRYLTHGKHKQNDAALGSVLSLQIALYD